MERPADRWSVVLLALVILAAAEGHAEAVRGYVQSAHTGARVPGTEVTLYLPGADGLGVAGSVASDSSGAFAFPSPGLQTGDEFVLSAVYGGVAQPTEALEVGGQQQVIVEVYELTAQAADLRIDVDNLFLALDGERVDVAHLVQVDNSSDGAYVGETSGGHRRVTPFALPDGLLDLQSHVGELVPDEDGLYYDRQPLLPGQTQIAFSFSLEARRLDDGYVHRAQLPTDRLEVFVQPVAVQSALPFEDLGVVSLHDSQYRRLRLLGLQPGQEVTVPLPIAPSRRSWLRWVALAATAVLASGVALAARRRPSSAPGAGDAAVLRQLQKELVARIALLDDAHEAGGRDPAYHSERQRLVAEAAAVTRSLDATDARP